jgi:hypothetical protein
VSVLGFALVKTTSAATHYTLVEIIARTPKRFTRVRSSSGMEWWEKTRGLWTFETREAAEAERAKLDEIWRTHRPFVAERLAA